MCVFFTFILITFVENVKSIEKLKSVLNSHETETFQNSVSLPF